MNRIIWGLTFLFLSLSVSAAQLIKRIEWDASPDFKDYYSGHFVGVVGNSVESIDLKLKIDLINKELFNSGFFDSTFNTELHPDENKDYTLKLIFKIKDSSRFAFNGNTLFSNIELKNKVYEKVKTELGKVNVDQIKLMLIDSYEEIGFFGTKIEVNSSEGWDRFNHKVKNYYIKIDEGNKIPIGRVEFRGNNAISTKELKELFFSSASPLSQDMFYDKSYAETFSNLIKKKYLTIGYVYTDVSRPRITNDSEGNIDIEYLVNEKSQVTIDKINLKNLPLELEGVIKDDLVNKEGRPINIIELETDFKKIITTLQNRGYYFASLSNANSNNILQYDKLNSVVDINLDVNLDRRACFNDVIVNGNIKTDSAVLIRELNFEKNELITPSKVDSFKQRISSLGLFTNLKVTPYMIFEEQKKADECARTNIIVQVKEKDFGAGELSLGYRTDLGAKTGLGVTWNNIGGMNRSLFFKTQANRRFNLEGLDTSRPNKHALIEHLTRVSFVEPYLFHNILKTQLELELASSWQRKRYYSFDADILKVSTQLSKNISTSLSTSIKWQLEKIDQFGAIASKDNDNFIIGSFTPTITFDRRDDQINPRKGYYLSLSSEWSNHYFGSMKNNEFEVNYIKVVTRNKLYIPIGNFVLATSVATGFEKNYAEQFYIPSIKVFRLDGFDEIRGFEDGEINRLKDGTKLSNVTVYNSAYFMAFKFEPRYNLTDSIQLDVFFDAGRVFVNEFKPLDLRTSVGAGLKFLTPVGSLDFDYGYKLRRENYSDGTRDATSRFHLSIGFF